MWVKIDVLGEALFCSFVDDDVCNNNLFWPLIGASFVHNVWHTA